jgi:uncharacterized glyoxalase superfamily protein PhnB
MAALTSDIMVELHVPSFETAKSFYGKLGFKVVWERKPQKRQGYLVMRRGKSILNFYCGNKQVYGQSYFKRFPKDTKRGYAVEMVIPVDEIEGFYEEVKKQAPKSIVEPLKLQPWGRRDFRIEDPFGFYLRFTERYDWVRGRDKKGNPLPA